MSRPLLITDCDEVLLHMVSHFRDWLGEAHDVEFAFETGQFAEALTDRNSGEAAAAEAPVTSAGRNRRRPHCISGDGCSGPDPGCRRPRRCTLVTAHSDTLRRR